MAEDKKPKIDLKSRLQKMGGAGLGPAAVPMPMGSGPASQPPPARPSPGMPVPPPSVPPPSGLAPRAAGGSSSLDPNNPLAAVAQPFKPGAAQAAAAAPQHQRIEVDEGAVQAARSAARKQGLLVGAILAAVVGGIGWAGGSASQQGSDRAKGVKDAHELSGDLLKAKASLDQVKGKVSDGGKTLMGEHKFPADLAQALSGINVDFSGDKLFGRRFAGVPADVSTGLFDFITRVQALNDKKELVVALLNKLQKPITEELAHTGGEPLTLVAVVDKDTAGGGLRLASLVTPIMPDDKNGVPDKLLFANPLGSGNVQLPRLTSASIPKDGAAIPVVPTSFDKVCPSPVKGQISQLVSAMNSLVADIEGQKGAESADYVTDAKPGLSDSASKLADALNKVN